LKRLALALALPLVLGACSSPAEPSSDAGPAPEDHVFGGARPVAFFRAPEGADPKKALPLVMVLHGYGASGLLQSIYFRLDKLVDEKQFLLVAPDGVPNKSGSRFWAASAACCEVDGQKVDDVKYLTGLIDEIASVWSVDRSRVYLVGHSNGGAMAYRLGCEAAETFAAAFMLAPAFFQTEATCAPKRGMSIAHLHGTADETVAYDGGVITLLGGNDPYPSASAAVATWARLNGCAPTADESAPPLDLDRGVAGAETKITRYMACRDGVSTELWTMAGSKHVPMDLAPDIGRQIWSWFQTHPRR